MRTLWLVVILLCSPPFIYPDYGGLKAQAVLGARELAMGQATTALPGSAFSLFTNQAMVPEDVRSVSFYGVRYYGLAEITDMAAAVTYPAKIGIISAGMHRYGYDLFNESRIRIGYKNIYKTFRFGIVANYSHVMQGGGYGNAGAIGLDVGMAAPVVPGLWIAMKATNINQPEYGSRNNEELPREMSIGFSYRLTSGVLFSSDLVKDVQFPVSYRFGVEATVIEHLRAMAGVTTSPQTFSAGFGYRRTTWGAHVGVQRHENAVLGYSPAIDFNIRW